MGVALLVTAWQQQSLEDPLMAERGLLVGPFRDPEGDRVAFESSLDGPIQIVLIIAPQGRT